MVESENSNNMTDKIKLFNSDESLKLLGELLSNKSSRDIIGLLIEKEMYKNAIATKLNLRLNLVSHHLEKMESIGLVEISNKKIIRKGEDHKFFRINPKIFLMPNHSEKEIKEKGILTKIFRDGIKFASIGIIGISSFIGSQSIQLANKPRYPPPNLYEELIIKIPYDIIWSIIIAGIFVAGSILFLKLKKRKKLR